jgi:Na+-transporting methylmalonyl-CoA/oxaloacetate decarboxylase gamma subunit
MMLNAANRTVIRLWKDESGVVFALTVIVFLTLFMMGLGVYAIGETVRQRVELQNAADAAAYSAAITQADGLSRVAAINRAMSWTYVQMVRKEMDYIVDKWLERVLLKWEIDNNLMRAFNAPSPCNNGVPWYVTGYNVSIGNGANHEKVLLNKRHLVTIDQIKQARQNASRDGKDYPTLGGQIDDHKQTIRDMNKKEQKLLEDLPKRIEKTVREVLRANIKDTWNDGFAEGARISFVIEQEKNPAQNYAEILKQDRENDFLRHSNYIPEDGKTAEKVFGEGSEPENWFVETGQKEGIQRAYKQRNRVLLAEWHYTSSLWVMTKAGCRRVATYPRQLREVKAEEVRDSRFTSEIAKANILRKNFFSKKGAIAVGVTRRLNNPLQFLVAGGELGIIRPFTVDNGTRHMWTVATARAGYNPPGKGKTQPPADCNGEYEETWEERVDRDDLWNLKTSDWDATLLPLYRAWTQGENRNWDGTSGGKILAQIKEGSWQPLYGEGGSPENERAPKLMGGGNVSYSETDAWVVH